MGRIVFLVVTATACDGVIVDPSETADGAVRFDAARSAVGGGGHSDSDRGAESPLDGGPVTPADSLTEADLAPGEEIAIRVARPDAGWIGIAVLAETVIIGDTGVSDEWEFVVEGRRPAAWGCTSPQLRVPPPASDQSAASWATAVNATAVQLDPSDALTYVESQDLAGDDASAVPFTQ